jgi:hypothetical protein
MSIWAIKEYLLSLSTADTHIHTHTHRPRPSVHIDLRNLAHTRCKPATRTFTPIPIRSTVLAPFQIVNGCATFCAHGGNVTNGHSSVKITRTHPPHPSSLLHSGLT